MNKSRLVTLFEVSQQILSTYVVQDRIDLLKGIDKKTVRREGVSICLLMFSSQYTLLFYQIEP